MRFRLIVAFIGACLALIMAPQTLSLGAQGRINAESDLPEREEIHRVYQLDPGARVLVSTINGPVDIETTLGSTADVHIVRSAQTREELDCYRTVVEHTPASLTVRHEQRCLSIRDHQRVRLIIPRSVDLTLKTISGRVDVGEVDGTVRLRQISGAVTLAQATGYSDLTEISGPVTVKIARLGERGLRVRATSGQLDLRLAGDLNADLDVNGLSGRISVDMPNVTVDRVGSSDYRARIGSGGAPILISGVSGNIKIRRA